MKKHGLIRRRVRVRRFSVAAGSLALLVAGELAYGGAQESAATQTLNRPITVVQSGQGLLEWHFNGRKLFAYAFGSNQFKPYVRELYSLDGYNVLRDAPADHLHHHGLMYAIRVSGVNFWEETGEPGHERHVKRLSDFTGRSSTGLPQAGFTELLHWVPHGDHTLADTAPAALLLEQRTLTLTVDEARREVALAWHAEFEAGVRTNRVTLHGSDYNGLGLRLPAAWDRVARHENSENAPFPAGGKPGAMPARWSAVSHTVDGHEMQVVLFASPAGHAGTNSFFAMTEPFTYLAATQGLDKAPLAYRAGQRLRLDYLLLVYSDARGRPELESRYQAWARELK
ncbi:MAG: PmoA family protein [Verrucomicrobia bacterium]|nr:PmoA family protein [Verrucomicrobiota bacterium]